MGYIITNLSVSTANSPSKINPINKEWSVRKDRDGYDMVFYKDIPAEEIIYCVGEISLAMTTSSQSRLQEEYYETRMADCFNISMKLLRNNEFANSFYSIYKYLNEEL